MHFVFFTLHSQQCTAPPTYGPMMVCRWCSMRGSYCSTAAGLRQMRTRLSLLLLASTAAGSSAPGTASSTGLHTMLVMRPSCACSTSSTCSGAGTCSCAVSPQRATSLHSYDFTLLVTAFARVHQSAMQSCACCRLPHPYQVRQEQSVSLLTSTSVHSKTHKAEIEPCMHTDKDDCKIERKQDQRRPQKAGGRGAGEGPSATHLKTQTLCSSLLDGQESSLLTTPCSHAQPGQCTRGRLGENHHTHCTMQVAARLVNAGRSSLEQRGPPLTCPVLLSRKCMCPPSAAAMVPSGPHAMRSNTWPCGSGRGVFSSTLGSSCSMAAAAAAGTPT